MSSSWESVGNAKLKKEDVFTSREGNLGLEAAVSCWLLSSQPRNTPQSIGGSSSTFRKISGCCWRWFPIKMLICSLTRARPSALDCLSHKWFMVSLSWSVISQYPQYPVWSSLVQPEAISSCSITSVQKRNWPWRPKLWFIFQSLKSLWKRVNNSKKGLMTCIEQGLLLALKSWFCLQFNNGRTAAFDLL